MSKMFKPMLAGKPDTSSDIRFPVLASPKIDGVRATLHASSAPGVVHVMSRSMKPIPNRHVECTLGIVEAIGLDGELIVGSATDPNAMQNTTSGVMSINKTPVFTFHVFDSFDAALGTGFDERLTTARERVTRLQDNWPALAMANRLEYSAPLIDCPFDIVEHKLITCIEELDEYEAKQLVDGYEGVMVRDPNGAYKFGRSTVREGGLLKLKRFSDGEAIVVDYVEEQMNDNVATTNELGRTKRSSHKENKHGKGTLGAFVCRRIFIDENGKRVESAYTFNIGTGMTAAERQEFWYKPKELLGKIIKFKHFEHGVVDAPRHPVFIGFRDARDM